MVKFLLQFRQVFCLLFCVGNCVFAEIENLEHVHLLCEQGEPLFVSLGSFCEPSHMLKFCDFRRAAFPFDWIVSFDGESLIQILEEDFSHFLGNEYFSSYGPAGHLLHARYRVEFLHDGNFNRDFFPQLENLKQKFTRRIERFRKLNEYPGKVFFLRAAYFYSTTDPHRFFKCSENLEITDAYALRLEKTLAQYFPQLDFTLIIINLNHGYEIEFEKRVGERVHVYRVNPELNLDSKINAYRKFFTSLSYNTNYQK